MRIEHIEFLLPDYLNKKLEESLRPGVELHLEQCASCRAELAELRKAFEELEAHQFSGPPDGYFTTVLPRVRERLEKKQAKPWYAHPLLIRIATPLAAGALALVLLTHVPLPVNDSEREPNPLQPVLVGVATEELVEVVLDQVHQQLLTTPLGESETSSLLALRVLGRDHLLADADPLSLTDDPVLGGGGPESLDQLSDSDIDTIVQRLGERTML